MSRFGASDDSPTLIEELWGTSRQFGQKGDLNSAKSLLEECMRLCTERLQRFPQHFGYYTGMRHVLELEYASLMREMQRRLEFLAWIVHLDREEKRRAAQRLDAGNVTKKKEKKRKPKNKKPIRFPPNIQHGEDTLPTSPVRTESAAASRDEDSIGVSVADDIAFSDNDDEDEDVDDDDDYDGDEHGYDDDDCDENGDDDDTVEEPSELPLPEPISIIPFVSPSFQGLPREMPSRNLQRGSGTSQGYDQNNGSSDNIGNDPDGYPPDYFFPLDKTHNFTLACSQCTRRNPLPGMERWRINPTPNHTCPRNTLFVHSKTEYSSCWWTRIRNRPFVEFSGPHQRCFDAKSSFCKRNPNSCCFAHSQEEMYIWNTEKYTPFDIETFRAVYRYNMTTQRQQPPKGDPKPRRVKFPLANTHNFTLGCRSCSEEVGGRWQVKFHQECIEDMLFVRSKSASHSMWIKIRNRQSAICPNGYRLCWNFPHEPCFGNDSEKCSYAHSPEEIKLWDAEKFGGRFNINGFKKQNSKRMQFDQKQGGLNQTAAENLVQQPQPQGSDNPGGHLTNKPSNSSKSQEGNFMDDLAKTYTLPGNETEENRPCHAAEKLTLENYATMMHGLLFEEEKHQQDIVSRLTSILKGKVSSYTEVPNGPPVRAGRGRKFAKIILNKMLSSEGSAGYLVQRECDRVLLRPRMLSGAFTEEAYEALIVSKGMGYGINGLGNDHLYVFVNERFSEAAHNPETKDEYETDLWIRFTLSRSSLLAMHFAIDQMLPNVNLLFPNPTQKPESKQYDFKTGKLNSQQLKAMNRILHHQAGDPILVVSGPFGTGKTMTLSTTALQLMKSETVERKSKILICTYSHSAADLFVLLLDELNRTEMRKIKIRRIYSKNRHLSTIPYDVRKYVLIKENHNGTRSPEMPSKEDVLNADIVVTTVHTSLQLVKMKVEGVFTHIFLDEAGQTLEAELLIPLSLAVSSTCIVLAGDVMQMSPQVYCPDAKKLKISLLERIFDRYEAIASAEGSGGEPKHLVSLTENYRNDQLILRFLSKVIYGDEEKLIWKSGIKTEGATLRFHVVHGVEKPGTGMSFINEEEVSKIEHILTKLSNQWPEEWGQKDMSRVAVTSMYGDQVHLIRRHLRRTGLGAVTVLQMENLQGRQYDSVVISTVHTVKARKVSSDYLGFFSDMKLVNTTISRAKYCVIVVGDAEALCTQGSNGMLWYQYLKLALERNGLMVKDPQQFMINMEKKKEFLATDDSSSSKSMEGAREDMERILRVFKKGKGEKLLYPLLTEVNNDSKEEFVPRNNLERITGVQILKHIKCDQNKGVARIDFSPAKKVSKSQKTRWRSLGMDYEDQLPQFDESDDADEESDLELEPEDEIDITETENLDELLSSEQNHRCRIDIFSMSNIKAVVLEGELKGKDVKIRHRRHCRRALDGDQVIVELTRNPSTGCFIEPLEGKVKVVTQRKTKMRYRTIVCRIHETNSALMCPLSSRLPLIFNLRRKDKKNRGHVAMYSMGRNENIINRKDLQLQHQQDVVVVMYLQWKSANNLPLGIVIGTLPTGDTEETGQEILQHLHDVPKSLPEITDGSEGSGSELGSCEVSDDPDRLDLRDKRIFTIDNPDSQDLDDALHVEEGSDGTFTVGVHIADVSHYVRQDSDIDKDAYKIGNTFYSANRKPIHMLPRHLGTGKCSLLPDQDKRAVTVMYKVMPNDDILPGEKILTIIRSKRKFTYDEVEGILVDSSTDDEWHQDLRRLYTFAQNLAKGRKGRVGALGIEDEETPQAHMLVEEWMVNTNTHIARYLLTKFPDLVPLRKQGAPSQEELDEWKKKYEKQVANSFCLRRITNILEEEVTEHQGFVHIFRDTWRELLVCHNEYQMLENIARSVRNFPEQFSALKSWHAMQKKTMYHCSGASEDYWCYNQGTQAYTHFTSPIRRYVDIVVHRFLKAAIGNTPVRYTKEEISDICSHCSGTEKAANDYQGDIKLLITACNLKEWPNEVHVVVKDVTEKEIEVVFLALGNMPHVLRAIRFAWLNLKEDPVFVGYMATMVFSQRIYDYGSSLEFSGNGSSLSSQQFTVGIPSAQWRLLFEAIVNRDQQSALETFRSIREVVGDEPGDNYTIDVSSEHAVESKQSQEITFKWDVKLGDVLRVQLSARLNKGILKPCIQLIKLTPSYHICLEHAQVPVNCFASDVLHGFHRGAGVYKYMKHWLSLLTMESAYSVTRNRVNQSAHIYNVPVEWSECSENVVHGRLKMSKSFCEKRFLLFSMDVLYGTVSTDDGGQEWMEMAHDRDQHIEDCANWRVTKFGFMCIKFNQNTKDGKSMTWVGHFLITNVLIFHDEVVVYLKLNQSSYPFPSEFLDASKVPLCAVHWLDKPIPDVRAEAAVLGLNDCDESSLLFLVTQGKLRPEREVRRGMNVHFDSPVLQPPNEEQTVALKAAVNEKNKFVLVWGPPGTGKSVTGVRLAYLFAQNNDPGKLVMYCGPSNKSVNVVTAKLKQLKVKVVRIFSEQLVQQFYPLPNFPLPKRGDLESVSDHKDVALHELVRLEGRQYAEEIAEYDRKFRENPQGVDMECILKYKKLLGKAYHAEVSEAEVILCTCGSSGNGLYKRVFQQNVVQVIVDECGMCTEPETLIPLLACDPKKVVLIGDHKQLQPIVSCPEARKGGLPKTLFEEFAGKAVMLQVQYRMHFHIQEFPSEKFYKGKLRCGNGQVQTDESRPKQNFWPAGSRKPIAFCHVDGVEKTQHVTTDLAGSNSHYNMEEVKQVITVVRALMKGDINKTEIAILTPYRLQLSKIREALNEHELHDVTVNTITNSQGSEWPFVILSTVRSLPKDEVEKDPWKSWIMEKLGFVTDEHQINVAITRAKSGLIIIGNKHLLRCDSTWAELLKFYEVNAALTDSDSFPPRSKNNRRNVQQ